MNPEQKVYVLLSNNFSDEQLHELKGIFNITSELHFKSLKKSEEGREKIIEFLNHPLITKDNITYSLGHKEYCAVGQMVDLLIEPVFYDIDYDLYQGAQNITLTNFIYLSGTFFWDKSLFKRLVNLFINMIRNKTNESINEFYSCAESLFNSVDAKTKEVLFPLLISQKDVEDTLMVIHKYSIDLSLSSFTCLCEKWYQRLKKKLVVIHDESKQMSFSESYMEFTRSLPVFEQQVGYGDRKLTFPMQIESFQLLGSKDQIGIQVSDLLASSIGFVYNNQNQKHNAFVEKIKNSLLFQVEDIHQVWPNTISPQELMDNNKAGNNILDFLASHR